MPSILRRRLYCHYCGQRSRFQLTPKEGRKFKCEHCEAVNFLDENGDIADVPPEEAASPRQYARAGSPRRHDPAQNTIFCSICLKNQALYTEALSQYYSDNGEYSEARYDAGLPKYKRELEDRYPQCCAQCEPRVMQQLQQATYIAKSDHIRRMLERSRQRRIARRWGWRRIVVQLGGILYGLSLIAQLFWHATGAVAIDGTSSEATNPMERLQLCWSNRQVSRGCMNTLERTVGPGLVLGLLSAWWNPLWQYKLNGNEGRIRGLQEFYVAQATLLLVRFGLWMALQGQSEDSVSVFEKPLHSISLTFELLICSWSMFFTLRIETAPPVNWQQELVPLLSDKQFVPPTRASTQLLSPQHLQVEQSASSGFSIGSFASSVRPQNQIWRPPTPPTDDPDQMDLDYTPAQFRPIQKPVLVKNPQPTPFYGTLPALPTNRLLHPKPETQHAPKQAIGIPPGFFDKSTAPLIESQQKSTGALFAPPKLFSRDAKVDTGLESIFGTVFSLKEEPVEIQDVQMQDLPSTKNGIFDLGTQPIGASLARPRQISWKRWSVSNIIALIFTSGLFISISFLLLAEYCRWTFRTMELGINAFAACILATHLLLRLRYSSRRSGSDIALLMGFSVLAALGWCRSLGVMGDRIHTKIIMASLALMIYPEAYLVFQDYSEQVTMASGNEAPQRRVQSEQNHSQAEGRSQPRWESTTPGWPDQDVLALTRPRTNSMGSDVSSVSAATTSSTATGWKTPKPANSRFVRPQTPGYTSGLGSLALDDRPVGRSVTGSRESPFGGRRR